MKQGTELEDQALCHKIMHAKYLINMKAGWFLVRNSDPVETEQMINTFMSCSRKHNFQNLKKLFCIVYVQNCLNGQGRLEERSKRLLF